MLTEPTDLLDPQFAVLPDENEIGADEEALPEEENTGMELGTSYKEDTEQDMDDLIHTPPGKDPNQIPPPEEA